MSKENEMKYNIDSPSEFKDQIGAELETKTQQQYSDLKQNMTPKGTRNKE